jgi:formate dehydrogenase major subunit
MRLPVRVPPLLRQLTSSDRLALGPAAQSPRSRDLTARTTTADRVVKSVCPYCAVGCAQNVYVSGERVVHIEGDPDSPISRGRLCPRGSSSPSLVNSETRQTKALYRAPHAADWEEIDLERAMDMIADRVIDTRARTWQERDENGGLLRRTLGFAHLGGATLDNEENYLIKKCFSALGAVQIENQARI